MIRHTMEKAENTYKLTAYIPDPRGGDNNFTYDGLIGIDAASMNPFEDILNRLAARISQQFAVPIQRKNFVIQHFSLQEKSVEITSRSSTG